MAHVPSPLPSVLEAMKSGAAKIGSVVNGLVARQAGADTPVFLLCECECEQMPSKKESHGPVSPRETSSRRLASNGSQSRFASSRAPFSPPSSPASGRSSWKRRLPMNLHRASPVPPPRRMAVPLEMGRRACQRSGGNPPRGRGSWPLITCEVLPAERPAPAPQPWQPSTDRAFPTTPAGFGFMREGLI